jgi:hypothetical protein
MGPDGFRVWEGWQRVMPVACPVIRAATWLRSLTWGLILTGVAMAAALSGEALAVQRESQAEKEANLKQQAKGGLFRKWTFDQDRATELPSGFHALSSREGRPAEWMVQVDATAPSPPNVVAVSSECVAEDCYHLLLAGELEYEYPDLTVRLRAAEGVPGRGGLVFGAKDSANFYGAVVDVAGSRVHVVRVVAGEATRLAHSSVTLKQIDWHTLRVQRNTIISKDFIEIFVDGSLVLSVEDQMLGLGKVGLVSKGTTSLFFDTLHAVPLFSHRPLSAPPAY